MKFKTKGDAIKKGKEVGFDNPQVTFISDHYAPAHKVEGKGWYILIRHNNEIWRG